MTTERIVPVALNQELCKTQMSLHEIVEQTYKQNRRVEIQLKPEFQAQVFKDVSEIETKLSEGALHARVWFKFQKQKKGIGRSPIANGMMLTVKEFRSNSHMLFHSCFTSSLERKFSISEDGTLNDMGKRLLKDFSAIFSNESSIKEMNTLILAGGSVVKCLERGDSYLRNYVSIDGSIIGKWNRNWKAIRNYAEAGGGIVAVCSLILGVVALV